MDAETARIFSTLVSGIAMGASFVYSVFEHRQRKEQREKERVRIREDTAVHTVRSALFGENPPTPEEAALRAEHAKTMLNKTKLFTYDPIPYWITPGLLISILANKYLGASDDEKTVMRAYLGLIRESYQEK